MRITKNITILFAITFWSFCVSAQYVTQVVNSSSGEFGWGSEGFYFEVSQPFVTSCSTSNLVVLQSNHPLFKETMATVLMAITTQSSLRVTVSGCYNNRPKVVAVGILSN